MHNNIGECFAQAAAPLSDAPAASLPDTPAAPPPDAPAAPAPPHPLGITDPGIAQICQRTTAVCGVMGFDSWKDGQEETITNVLKGHDTCAWLPTGGGKSLVYMVVVASVLGGLCVSMCDISIII